MRRAAVRRARKSDGRDRFDDWQHAQGGFRRDRAKSGRDAFTLQGGIYKQEGGERVARQRM
jgi:hypothetical protein